MPATWSAELGAIHVGSVTGVVGSQYRGSRRRQTIYMAGSTRLDRSHLWSTRQPSRSQSTQIVARRPEADGRKWKRFHFWHNLSGPLDLER